MDNNLVFSNIGTSDTTSDVSDFESDGQKNKTRRTSML